MKTSISTAADSPQDQGHAVWAWIKRHRLLVGAAAIVVLGLALGWNWLAAIGALPILLFLPCLLMMGMCMKGMRSNSTGSAGPQNKQTGSADSESAGTPASQPGPSSQRMMGMCMMGMRSNSTGSACTQNIQTTENPPPAGSTDSASTGTPASLPGPSSQRIEEKDHA